MSRETSINLSVIAVALWLLSYAMVLAYFRQRTPKPGPPIEELREESPAVVGLLVNNFEPGVDLVEATLLDLGARGFLEFYPSESGRHTVHIGKDYPAGLTAFDQQVFDRVRDSAIGGVAQLDRAVFDDLYKTAQREARDAGLSQMRFDWRTQSWLIVGAAAAAVVVGGSLYWASGCTWARACSCCWPCWAWSGRASGCSTPRPGSRPPSTGSACASSCAGTPPSARTRPPPRNAGSATWATEPRWASPTAPACCPATAT